MGMNEMLDYLMENSEERFKKQIQYIKDQLNNQKSEMDNDDASSDSNEDENDIDDNDDDEEIGEVNISIYILLNVLYLRMKM